jgi:hypothetical protein
MEARQTFRGAMAPKGLVVVLAICATVGVAATAATISKNLSGSSASVKSTVVHAAPGSVLRQDNPVQAAPTLIDRGAERGSTGIQNGSRGGVLEDRGNAGLADEHGPDSDLTRALPTAPAGYPAPNHEGYGA